MKRTKEAFIAAQKKGLIKMVNRQIKSVSFAGSYSDFHIEVELYANNPEEIRNSIYFTREQFLRFIRIFENDNLLSFDEWWSSKELEGVYIRMCYYMTPKSEMHELADPEEYVGIKHIIDDDPNCYCTYIEG